MRILVCGDRNWTNVDIIKAVLRRYNPETDIVINGGARGADRLGAITATLDFGFEVRTIMAEWGLFGKAAGPKRNQKMLEMQPDIVLAFHDDLEHSKGTKDMVKRAIKAGVLVKNITSWGDEREAN